MDNEKSLWSAIGGWIGTVFGRPQLSPTQEVAAAQMAGGTFRHSFESDKDLQELIQGTISDCMNVRSSERSVLRFVVSTGDKKRANDPVCIALQKLIDTPNPIQTRVDFLELASQHFDANGNVFIRIIPGADSLPAEMYIMPSRYVAPRFSATDKVIPDAYQWQDGRATISPDDLVIVRRNSIKTGPYKGRGVLLESEATIRLLNATLQAQRNYFDSGGAPNVALIMPDGIDYGQEAINLYQKMWHDKYNPATGSTNIGVLPQGASVVNFGPQELGFHEAKKDIKDDLCQAFQTPYMMLGDVGDANFNNGQVAVALFERNVVLRFGQKMAAAFEAHFKRNVHPSITVEVDPEIIASFTQLSDINGLANADGNNSTHPADRNADSAGNRDSGRSSHPIAPEKEGGSPPGSDTGAT